MSTTTTPAGVNGATPGELRADPRPRRKPSSGRTSRDTSTTGPADASRSADRDASGQVLPDAVASRPGRQPVIQRASEITPEPVVWAWVDDGNGRVPAGALTVAAGREGTGKSSFGIWLAAKVTRGTLPGSLFGKPRSVIYVAVEDSWKHTLVPRLIAAGADLDRVLRLAVAVDDALGEHTLCLPLDIRLLESVIQEHGVGLVVVDPLMSVIAAGIDTHRAHETRQALEPLAQMADRTGAVVLGIAHFSKAQHTDVSSLISGSGAFKDVARAILGFATDHTSGTGVISQSKNSVGVHDLPSLSYRIDTATVETPTGDAEVGCLVMLGTSDRSVTDILAATHADDGEEQRDAAAWLRSYLLDNGGEALATDAIKAGDRDGFTKDTLKRAKKAAKVDSRKTGMDTGWTWFLTDPPAPVIAPAEGSEGSEGSEGRSPKKKRALRAPFADQDLPDLVEESAKGAVP